MNRFENTDSKYVDVLSDISPETITSYFIYSIANILRKTIEGYVFYFNFIAKGIIFSTQIINRYVAEPSLCRHSINFSRCLDVPLAETMEHP